KLKQNLYITYSNQKVRDLKQSSEINSLDKIITLDTLILELFEKSNFQTTIDEIVGASIIYKIIQEHHIEYFSYLQSDAQSLDTIFKFIIKCKRNNISFETTLKGEKLEAINSIETYYTEFKLKHNLVDTSDIEKEVLENWDSYCNQFTQNFTDIFVDDFNYGNISYIKSDYQKHMLENFSIYKKIPNKNNLQFHTKLIKPKNEVFDTMDEVKTAIKIARKLLLDGVNSDDIIIVASDISEYAPLYKLFLDEYGMSGFSSLGTSLNSFKNSSNFQVEQALKELNEKVNNLSFLYKKLGLVFDKTIEENLKSTCTILDERIGVELTEPNQLVGLSKSYKHIIFIGTDINHFPPKSNDNFLYSYEDDVKYFYSNNYFTSSQTQYNELKRLSENLYIITANYSGKRELSASIIIDKNTTDTIDISDIKSVHDLALEKQTQIPSDTTKEYYESIVSTEFTKFDGLNVEGIQAKQLSASQINKYNSCPLAYLYGNKIKIEAPGQDEEGFDVMEQGSLMHLCYELFGAKIKEHHIKSTDQEELHSLMYEVSIEAYNHKNTMEPRGKKKVIPNILHKIFLSTLQAGLKDERDLGLLAKFVNYYIKNADEFNYFKNTEFEKEFALDNQLKPYELKDENDTNYFIKGFIDRFDNLKDHINIVDYKSKKVKGVDKKKQEEVDTLKDIQLSLYILYTKQNYPNKSYDSHLLSFKGNDSGVKFASLGNETFDGFEDELKKMIFDTKDSIENGEFGFDDSDEQVCGWCDIRNICHVGVLSKNKN
ncbi:MAG: PD-(D/E)XK nuclease family protein, partial [Arcobacteraceae bacterium]